MENLTENSDLELPADNVSNPQNLMEPKAPEPLDPKLQDYLRLIQESGRQPLYELSPQAARIAYREARGFAVAKPEAVAEVKDFSIPGPHGEFTLRLYRPEACSKESPAASLLYFHGGGWTIGDIDTHDSLCRQLANDTPCVVISVDYHLAPEFPFPAAIEDGLAAVNWVWQRADELGLDQGRIAIGGDSAGANLSTVICLLLRDQKRLNPEAPQLVHQLLYYPATDQRLNFPSHVSNGEGYFLTNKLIKYFRHCYLGENNFEDWRASPLLAEDLSGLPGAHIVTAGYDPLLDEGLAYAEKLRQAGGSVVYDYYQNQIHGFINIGNVSSEARAAVRHSAKVLANSFKNIPLTKATL